MIVYDKFLLINSGRITVIQESELYRKVADACRLEDG